MAEHANVAGAGLEVGRDLVGAQAFVEGHEENAPGAMVDLLEALEQPKVLGRLYARHHPVEHLAAVLVEGDLASRPASFEVEDHQTAGSEDEAVDSLEVLDSIAAQRLEHDQEH